MNTVVPGGVGLLVTLVFLFIGAYLSYWVVRLGVRHGIRDSRREAGGGGAPDRGDLP